MKKSEQAESSEGEDGVDMIDEVLQLILSRLEGTEEAIRSSILSRRWRYLWTSVPSIDIDYARGLKSSQEFKRNEFKEFVAWVLANKTFDLDSFRLRCSNYYNMSTIRKWIGAAVTRKVKLLDLMFHSWWGENELPQCLVTCDSLEVLKLCLLKWPLSLPKFTGFPALRVLELNQVEFFDDKYNVVKYFLESCPLLEDLSLIDCRAYSLVISSSNLKDLSLLHCRFDSLVISSPKVKNLRIYAPLYSCHSLEICCPKLEFLNLAGSGSVADKFLFESLDSLKKVMIHPECSFEVKLPFDFLVTISNVEYFSTSVWCIEKWFDLEADTHVSLPNLKTLELTVDDFGIRELIPFLTCLPDLESFHLIIPKYVYGLDKLNPEEAETINILTRHLKKVEFLKFDEEKSKLVVVCALLEHGNLLEEMVFNWGDEAKCHVRSKETMKEVSNFPKASSTVKLTAVFN